MKDIYLDYSATTKVDKMVLDVFYDISLNYFANPNSSHPAGIKALKQIELATNVITNLLNIKDKEIIYTSGASESNNLAIKGIVSKNKNTHIITTILEHPSIITTIGYLQKEGYVVDFVNINNEGLVDINHLKQLIDNKPTLISIGAVSSEIGVRQPIEEIGKLLNEYQNCVFHVDITQCLGKSKIDLSDVDLASFSSHKIYGLKGTGGLIKNKNIKLQTQIHGGKSISIYRSGTPDTAGICALAKAMEIVYSNFASDLKIVNELNAYLRRKLCENSKIIINSPIKSVPHILNFSVVGIKRNELVSCLEDNHIYISTKTACADPTSISKAVMTIQNNEDLASSSMRISLSKYTTMEELDIFIKVLNKYIK